VIFPAFEIRLLIKEVRVLEMGDFEKPAMVRVQFKIDE